MNWLAIILPLLGVGGIAAAAFAFPPFGLFVGGALKGLMRLLRSVPWYVWLGLALAGVIAFLAISRGNWMDRANAAEAQLAAICAETRKAAGNPKLACKDTAEQVRLLGKAVTDLKGAIGRQNAAVARMGAETKRQQDAAAVAQKRAEKRAGRAETTAEGLMASSRSKERLARPCEPSTELKGHWQ